MPIVVDPVYGPKPGMTLLGGSPGSLPLGSTPFMPSSRSIELTSGTLRTVSYASIYRSQPVIGAAVKAIAFAIARLPLQAFRYTDAAEDTRERDKSHPAAQLLSKPRPQRRGFHLRWDMALSLWVHGNYVAWKRRPRAGAPPTELWTLDWRLLVPIVLGSRVIAWKWLGEGIPGLDRGAVIFVEDTLHLAFGTPGGGDIGISPLEQLQVTIRSEDALQRYGEASMRNGTRFGVAAILDKSVKADRVVRDGVRDELVDAHGGLENAFRPAVLGGGITDIKPLSQQSAAEAELIQQRVVNRAEAGAVIGAPLAILGFLEGTNYAALKELHRIFYVTSLGGPLTLLAESVQAQLLDGEPAWADAGRFVEFSLDEVLKGDAKERWETYDVAVGMGGLTLNDVRRSENRKPYDDPRADEPLIKANNVRPLSAVGQDNGTRAGRRSTDPAALTAIAARARDVLEALAATADAGDEPSFDRLALERDLTADLQAAGLNGSSATIAEAIADELDAGVRGLAARRAAGDLEADDVAAAVRELAATHPLTSNPGDPNA